MIAVHRHRYRSGKGRKCLSIVVAVFVVAGSLFGKSALAQSSGQHPDVDDVIGQQAADALVEMFDALFAVRDHIKRMGPMARDYYRGDPKNLDAFIKGGQPDRTSADHLKFVSTYRSDRLDVQLVHAAMAGLNRAGSRTKLFSFRFAVTGLSQIIDASLQLAKKLSGRDGFWIADVSGLNRFLDHGAAINLLDLKIAQADLSPLGNSAFLVPPLGPYKPHYGYGFKVLPSGQNSFPGPAATIDTGGPVLATALVLCAQPTNELDDATLLLRVEVAATGKRTQEFLGKEGGVKCPENWPVNPEGVGWSRLVLDVGPPRRASGLYQDPALGMKIANRIIGLAQSVSDEGAKGTVANANAFLRPGLENISKLLGDYYDLDGFAASRAARDQVIIEELVRRFRPDRLDLFHHFMEFRERASNLNFDIPFAMEQLFNINLVNSKVQGWSGLWAKDISGLFRILSDGHPIAQTDSFSLAMTAADEAPLGPHPGLAPPAEEKNLPYDGYLFSVMGTGDTASMGETTIFADLGPGILAGSSVAYCARPATYLAGARMTMIFRGYRGTVGRLPIVEMDASKDLFVKDLNGKCVTEWPKNPASEGWMAIYPARLNSKPGGSHNYYSSYNDFPNVKSGETFPWISPLQ